MLVGLAERPRRARPPARGRGGSPVALL